MRTSIIQVAVATLLCSGLAISADLSEYEKICRELGFKNRTPAYGECVLELDRRSTDQQKQAERTRVEQQRQAQELQQRQSEQKRQEEERQRTTAIAARGDGTPDHQSCQKYGFIYGTAPYSECRQKIDLVRQESAQKQSAYESENYRYQQQVADAQKEKEKKQNDKLFEFSMRLLGGSSPNFGQAVGNAATGTMGITPIAPPRQPTIENFTIRGPSGAVMRCTYVNNIMDCR